MITSRCSTGQSCKVNAKEQSRLVSEYSWPSMRILGSAYNTWRRRTSGEPSLWRWLNFVVAKTFWLSLKKRARMVYHGMYHETLIHESIRLKRFRRNTAGSLSGYKERLMLRGVIENIKPLLERRAGKLGRSRKRKQTKNWLEQKNFYAFLHSVNETRAMPIIFDSASNFV